MSKIWKCGLKAYLLICGGIMFVDMYQKVCEIYNIVTEVSGEE